MTIEELGSIGELVGAIATVATLIYLAIQIRSNSRITRSAALQATLDGGRDHTIAPILNNPELVGLYRRGMTSLEYLDADEQARFTWFLCESVLQMQNIMHLHEEGILATIEYDAWMAYTASIITTPGAKEVWPQVAAIVSPAIANILLSYLEANPDQPSLLELMPVMKVSEGPDNASA
jgi:hypothetical protein